MAISSKKRLEEPDDGEPQNGERLILGVDRPAKRMHYRTVSAPLHTLDQAVNSWIAQGWRPLGGPFIDSRDGTAHQALTKEI